MAEYRLTDRLRMTARYIRDHREPQDDSLLDEAAERIKVLEAAIEAAPHGEDCIRLEDHKGRPCDCWKTTVQHSAEGK